MKRQIIVLACFLLAGCSMFSHKTSAEYLAMGEMYYKTGDYKKALKDLNKAIEKDAYNMEAYASRGTLLFGLQEYDSALSDFNIVLQAEGERSEVYSAIGATYAAKGDYKEARENLLKALEINPANVEALCSLGGVYFSTENYKAAIEEYTKAIKLRPAPQAYFARALAYEKYGLIKEAAADYKMAGVSVDLPEPKEGIIASVPATELVPAQAVKVPADDEKVPAKMAKPAARKVTAGK